MSNTDTPGVNPWIQNADGDRAGSKKVRGDIGVHRGVEEVEKERPAIDRKVTKYRKNELTGARLRMSHLPGGLHGGSCWS